MATKSDLIAEEEGTECDRGLLKRRLDVEGEEVLLPSVQSV